MSKLVVATLALAAGIGIGKYGCGAAAPKDRVQDLERTKEGISKMQDAVGMLRKAWDETEPSERVRRIQDEGWSFAEPEARPRKGMIVMEPGMVVDPEARIVYRVPIQPAGDGTYIPDPEVASNE